MCLVLFFIMRRGNVRAAPVQDLCSMLCCTTLPCLPPAAASDFQLGGIRLKALSARLDWMSARSTCQLYGMDLASDSEEWETNLHSNITAVLGSVSYWLGGTDDSSYVSTAHEGSWAWSDGSTWGITKWNSKSPDGGSAENCIAVVTSNRWIDLPCTGGQTSQLPSVCAALGESFPSKEIETVFHQTAYHSPWQHLMLCREQTTT